MLLDSGLAAPLVVRGLGCCGLEEIQQGVSSVVAMKLMSGVSCPVGSLDSSS